jgi:ectoine hydroxylase-related dioxygenase (phytanoyl-CoA dioxygenase family)
MSTDPFFLRSFKRELFNACAHIKLKPKFKSKTLKELDKSGISVIPNFYNSNQIKKLKEDALEIFSRSDLNIYKDETNSDTRAFGANWFSNNIDSFCNNKEILKILETYEGHEMKLKFTMANLLIPKVGNTGSGGGWHRDSPREKQTKAILYLTDVNTTNGPFQYIKGTHKPLDVLKHRLFRQPNLNQKRITEGDVNNLLKNSSYKITEITAKAGDLILVDTRGIHRGKPMETGERIALTNYYFKSEKSHHHFKQVALDPNYFK